MSGQPEIITFGCRLNAHDSEVMRENAEAAGLGDDLVIINTCAVTAEAERQARQAIRKAKRDKPHARVVVTGCSAQISPEAYAEMDEVSAVLGNEEKLDLAQNLAPRFGVNDSEPVRVNDIMQVTEIAPHMIDGFGDRARAFVQVQTGCDHRCTFCIIPFGRGNARSVPAGVVVDQVKRLVDAGFNEVVLTGVDITSYGPDLPGKPSLGVLVQKILANVPALPRLRISSIDSIEVDEPLFDAIAGDKRLMPHLHLSLQSGDDMILKRMKRRHLRDQSISFCEQVRAVRPDIAFGADLIAGFPTETEAMFENSLKLVDECGLSFLHVFPYSPREGTPAAKMPQLDRGLIKDRAAQLRAKGNAATAKHLQAQLGRTVNVLVEREGRARAEDFCEVQVSRALAAGTLASVTIQQATNEILIAEPTT